MKSPILLFLLLFFCSSHTLAQVGYNPVTTDETYREALALIREHIDRSLIFPIDARNHKIEGIVYVQFEIDSSGVIMKQSVRTIKGLHPSCDREAERVVRVYRKPFLASPFYRKEKIQRFTVPVCFISDPEHLPVDLPRHLLMPSVATVVIPKTANVKNPDWSVYKNKGMLDVIGKVSPGDSVEVTGWAAWSYFIHGKNVIGYVSRYAIHINEALDSLSKVIETQSELEETREENARAIVVIDTVQNFSSETAYLSVAASKKEIFQGECTVITLAFNVRSDNVLPLQFYDLGSQLFPMVRTHLKIKNSLILNDNIGEITGVEQWVGAEEYTSYPFFRATYCPLKPEDIQIPVLKLKMLLRKPVSNGTNRLVKFQSAPMRVKVKPLPLSVVTSTYGDFKMIGKYTMEEKVFEKTPVTGKPFTYQVKIKGAGITLPIKPPKLVHPHLSVRLEAIDDQDTIIGGSLQSSKAFTYSVMPLKQMEYDFVNKISFKFFNPETAKTETIHSSMKIKVEKGSEDEPFDEAGRFQSKVNFIAFDVSQSMQVEDYLPSRLHVAKDGIKRFFNERDTCDIGLIIFGGRAKHFETEGNALCYSVSAIDSISDKSVGNGTAIGDAIWLANISVKENAGAGKLVIIGDGDNTAGVLSPSMAAAFAKKDNFTIYAIGIGTKGLVPYGTDRSGKLNMIDNTFSDYDFMEITRLTGGKYYHVKDAEEISKVLKQIFQE